MIGKIKKKIISSVLAGCMAAALFAAGGTGAVAVRADNAVSINEANFPDETFKEYVSDEFDADSDGTLSSEEISNAEEIDLYNSGVTSLKGIEHLTSLMYLDCGYNELTSLDLSRNTALEYLDCYHNRITSLNVSGNGALTELYCSDNCLTVLNTAQNIALTVLDCSGNGLTALDVSNNTALQYLYCGENQLTSLDTSQNAQLSALWCENNLLTALDTGSNADLIELFCGENRLTEIDVSKNASLIELDCAGNTLTSLDVSANTNLEYLNCDNNQITLLDIRNNALLADGYSINGLFCQGNPLLTFTGNGTVSLPDLSYYYPEGNNESAVYNPEGKTFEGWYGSTDKSGSVYIDDVAIKGKTYYAKWKGGKISGILYVSIAVPVSDSEAQTVITDTKDCAGSILWSPALSDGKFATGTVYTAAVTLTAEDDRVFDSGISVKVSGAKVTDINIASGGSVLTFKAVFPQTGTENTSAQGGKDAGDEVSPDNKTETQAMYRLYNPNSGEHFYTASAEERDSLVSLGWSDEGIGWYAPVSSNTPVYRLYNPNPSPKTGSGEHHYTTSAAERDNLINAGWEYEGIGWYSDDAKGVLLYRLYNPNEFNNNHHYTTSKDEHDYLISLGWRDEGIAWYGVSQ